jgi:hypothetical protein
MARASRSNDPGPLLASVPVQFFGQTKESRNKNLEQNRSRSAIKVSTLKTINAQMQ